MNVSLFSRDDRTFYLFRSAWYSACINKGLSVSVFNRGFGIYRLFFAQFIFFNRGNSIRIIFGTSEICLYLLLSKKTDIFVFTGLGRLLLQNNFVSVFFKFYLKIFFKGQSIIVLNPHDRIEINKIFKTNAIILNGEGYKFKDVNSNYYTSLQNRIGSDQNIIKFAYVGRVLKSKGVDLLLYYFSKYAASNWRLYIIGDSDFSNSDSINKAELDRLVNLASGKIILMGFQLDVKSCLENHHFLISLSKREGLPFAVLDGIDVGAYLILSSVPGHLAFAEFDGVSLIEPDSLGNLFYSIMKNPEDFLNFNRQNRRIACEKKFGYSVIENEISTILECIIN